ncbi:TIGR04255 family protein [Asticcacaulis sp.]|uniref:TIGR04255 family protein n=1 Tax=Asticcacaulis sp. TaxID=1872648 RepID=UPI0031E2192C
MNLTPKTLQNAPIADALVQFRFITDTPLDGAVLGGLYADLGHSRTRVEPVNVAASGSIVNIGDDNRFLHKLRIVVDEKFIVLIGSSIITVGIAEKYTGWDELNEMATKVIELCLRNGLNGFLERISIKYTNILPYDDDSDKLFPLNMQISTNGRNVKSRHIVLRYEESTKNHIRIVEVAAPVSGKNTTTNKPYHGLLLALDVVEHSSLTNVDEIHNLIGKRLSTLHDDIKELFFSFLTEQTLEQMGPVYG